MGKKKEFSAELRSAIYTLHKEMKSERQIAAQLKISKSGVQNTLVRFEEMHSSR